MLRSRQSAVSAVRGVRSLPFVLSHLPARRRPRLGASGRATLKGTSAGRGRSRLTRATSRCSITIVLPGPNTGIHQLLLVGGDRFSALARATGPPTLLVPGHTVLSVSLSLSVNRYIPFGGWPACAFGAKLDKTISCIWYMLLYNFTLVVVVVTA